MPVKKWSEMTDSEKRVTLAKDVISQLKKNKLNACSGTYLMIINLDNVEDNEQLNKVLKKQGTCEVCAKGALFISHIMRNNHFTVGDYYSCRKNDNEKIKERLDSLFSLSQLELIEKAFEGESHDNELKDSTLIDLANEFHYYYEDDEERLIAIMNNIIENKGTFKL